MCEEWVKVNPGRSEPSPPVIGSGSASDPAPPAPPVADLLAPPAVPRPGAVAPPPVATVAVDPSAPLVLEPPPPKALSKAKAAALAALELGIDDGERRQGPTVRLPLPAYTPAKEISPEALADLERVGAVALLDVPAAAGQVALVPELTGQKDRLEITYRQAATIRMLVDVFPGAQVVFFGRAPAAPAATGVAVDTTLDLDPNEQRPWRCPHCGNGPDASHPGWCVGGHAIAGWSPAMNAIMGTNLNTAGTANSPQSSTANTANSPQSEDTTEDWDS